MKIVVLGATGQLGGNLTRALCNAGHEVVSLCRAHNQHRLAGLDTELVIHEQPTTILCEQMADTDWVVDAAAPYPLDLFIKPDAYRDAEIRTRNIIRDCVSGNAGLCYISSYVTLAGDSMGLLQRLKHRSSPYFVLKTRLEKIVCEHPNLKRIVVNPGAVLGPGDLKPIDQSLIGSLLANAIPLAHDTPINIIDARDLASMLVALMQANENFGPAPIAGHTVLVSELIHLVGQIANIEPPRALDLPDPLINIGAAMLETAATATNLSSPAPALLAWLMTEGLNTELAVSPDDLRPLSHTIKDCVAERLALAG